MAEEKIRLPSGQGGLTRYFEDSGSKIEVSPGTVIVLCIVIIIIVALLHYFGGRFLA